MMSQIGQVLDLITTEHIYYFQYTLKNVTIQMQLSHKIDTLAIVSNFLPLSSKQVDNKFGSIRPFVCVSVDNYNHYHFEELVCVIEGPIWIMWMMSQLRSISF